MTALFTDAHLQHVHVLPAPVRVNLSLGEVISREALPPDDVFLRCRRLFGGSLAVLDIGGELAWLSPSLIRFHD